MTPPTNRSIQSPPTVADLHVVQRDDGRYQIGLADDAPGPFESREFAQAVATSQHRDRGVDFADG